MPRFRHMLLAALAIPALMLGAIACGDDNDAESNSSAPAQNVDAINARIQRNELATALLDPAPSDFRLHVPVHDDPQFFAFIANGYPGSAMPAWRDRLSEDDIRNLVNLLRAEFSEAPTVRN